MKKILFSILMICIVTGMATGQLVENIRWGDQSSYSSLPANSLRKWVEATDAIALSGGQLTTDTAGTIYYVDGNKALDTGDGLTWATAKQLLSSAMALSHANIAVSARRQWAGRNRIYVKGDFITEDLTKGAQKTDVIGVGSLNQYKKAGIMGAHVIEAAATAHYMGMRWFNFQFRDDGAGGILFDIPIDQNGWEFHGCDFQVNATDTIGLRLGGCHDTKIIGCTFRANTSGVGFSTAAIQVLQGAGALTNVNISGNQISSGGIGIDWNETANVNSWITDNYFFTTGMGIDSEDVANLLVVGNRIKTMTASADDTSNDFNILYAIDNIVTGTDTTIYIPSPADF